MIEINLLPQELKRSRATGKFDLKSLQAKHLIYLIPTVFALLIFMHVYLGVAGIIRGAQLGIVNRRWRSLAVDRNRVEQYKGLHQLKSADAILQNKLGVEKLNWSEKLNKLSLHLPYGIWFNDLSLKDADFVLRGSVISLQGEEMTLIKKFIESLKDDQGFFSDFDDIRLSSVERRTIAGYDVADFHLNGKVKQ
ncbi:PilN domain-containing protein [Candidatus Omnitrophota bacterium]